MSPDLWRNEQGELYYGESSGDQYAATRLIFPQWEASALEAAKEGLGLKTVDEVLENLDQLQPGGKLSW